MADRRCAQLEKDMQQSIRDLEGHGGAVSGALDVFTCEPETVHAIFASQFSEFGKGDIWRLAGGGSNSLYGHGIFDSDKEQWRKHRKALHPYVTSMSPSKMLAFEASFQSLLKHCANKQAASLEKSWPAFRCYNLCDALRRLMFDTTMNLAFGEQLNAVFQQDFPLSCAIQDLSIAVIPKYLLVASGIPGLQHLKPKRINAKPTAILNNFILKYVADIMDMRQAPDREDRLASATSFVRQLVENDYDEQTLRDVIFDLIFSTTESSATSLTWALYELAHNKHVFRKLRDEIRDTVGFHQVPTREHIASMTYLKNITSESLRLNPSIAINIRSALVDTTLPRGGGIHGREPLPVRRGTYVVYSPDALHKRKDIYGENALVFDPDRWANLRPASGEYVPFHLGRRPCLGTEHALLQMRFLICRIAQTFQDIDCFDGKPLNKAASLFNYPSNAITAHFHKEAQGQKI